MIQMKPKLMLGSFLVLIALLAFAPIYSANAVDAAPYLRLGAGAQSIGVGGASPQRLMMPPQPSGTPQV